MSHTPDLRDRVPQGAGSYALGTSIEPALPNIKGEIGISGCGWLDTMIGGSGVFYNGPTRGLDTARGIGYGYSGPQNVYFDPSRISSIFKDDCTTVQPPALAINFYIKAK